MSGEYRIELLAALLREHTYRPSAARGVERCACGQSSVGEPGWHLRHIAAWLEPLIAERVEAAKAEALREAADAIWVDGGFIGGVQWGRADYVGWLRDRAAALDPEARS